MAIATWKFLHEYKWEKKTCLMDVSTIIAFFQSTDVKQYDLSATRREKVKFVPWVLQKTNTRTSSLNSKRYIYLNIFLFPGEPSDDW